MMEFIVDENGKEVYVPPLADIPAIEVTAELVDKPMTDLERAVLVDGMKRANATVRDVGYGSIQWANRVYETGSRCARELTEWLYDFMRDNDLSLKTAWELKKKEGFIAPYSTTHRWMTQHPDYKALKQAQQENPSPEAKWKRDERARNKPETADKSQSEKCQDSVEEDADVVKSSNTGIKPIPGIESDDSACVTLTQASDIQAQTEQRPDGQRPLEDGCTSSEWTEVKVRLSPTQTKLLKLAVERFVEFESIEALIEKELKHSYGIVMSWFTDEGEKISDLFTKEEFEELSNDGNDWYASWGVRWDGEREPGESDDEPLDWDDELEDECEEVGVQESTPAISSVPATAGERYADEVADSDRQEQELINNGIPEKLNSRNLSMRLHPKGDGRKISNILAKSKAKNNGEKDYSAVERWAASKCEELGLAEAGWKHAETGTYHGHDTDWWEPVLR